MITKHTPSLLLPAAALLLAVVNAEAQSFSTIYSFDNNDLETPVWDSAVVSDLVLSGRTLYGVTMSGGGSSLGTVFRVNTDGSCFTNLYSFTGGDGENPVGSLALSGDALYGITQNGGLSGVGSLFRVNTDGSDFTNLYSFSPLVLQFTDGSYEFYTNNDGAYPTAGLILSGDTLFGMTQAGGRGSDGTIFSVNTNGADFTTRYDVSGFYPGNSLVLSGDTLYGTASYYYSAYYDYESTALDGLVFSIKTNDTIGLSLQYVYSSTNDDFDRPWWIGNLIVSNNVVYGTVGIAINGVYGFDYVSCTVFSISTDGTDLTNLSTFGSLGRGEWIGPTSLVLSANTLYGINPFGGDYTNGTLFALNTDTTNSVTLYNFTGGKDRAIPQPGMVMSGNTLYGTTIGAIGSGEETVFALSLGPIPMNIQTTASNLVITWGNPAFSLQAASSPGGAYMSVPGAASPYSVATTNSQMFFRLKGN